MPLGSGLAEFYIQHAPIPGGDSTVSAQAIALECSVECSVEVGTLSADAIAPPTLTVVTIAPPTHTVDAHAVDDSALAPQFERSSNCR